MITRHFENKLKRKENAWTGEENQPPQYNISNFKISKKNNCSTLVDPHGASTTINNKIKREKKVLINLRRLNLVFLLIWIS